MKVFSFLFLVISLLLISCGTSPVIVYKYDYQAQPQSISPGTPPLPPDTSRALRVDYQTIYSSAWDDPSLVIFKNDSYRRIRVEIDGQKPIILEPYGATADLHLRLGEHQVLITIEKPTAARRTWKVKRFLSISIRREGRSQIFYLYDY